MKRSPYDLDHPSLYPLLISFILSREVFPNSCALFPLEKVKKAKVLLVLLRWQTSTVQDPAGMSKYGHQCSAVNQRAMAGGKNIDRS